MKPVNKLPLSPKKSFGSLNIEKLKHKKISRGIAITIRYNLISSLDIKKYKILKIEIVDILSTPSKPSK